MVCPITVAWLINNKFISKDSVLYLEEFLSMLAEGLKTWYFYLNISIFTSRRIDSGNVMFQVHSICLYNGPLSLPKKHLQAITLPPPYAMHLPMTFGMKSFINRMSYTAYTIRI